MKRIGGWISSNFWPLLPAFLALLGLASLAAGCAAAPRPWPLVSAVHTKGHKRPPKRPITAATLVENSLQRRGLSFGTDGSVQALYSYATMRHESIDPREARPGDIVFFDTSSGEGRCGGHVGLVQGIAPGGALKFRERRNEEDRESVADPMRPSQRRDDNGRVINTFMQPRKPNDREGTRYYAGQMVCAVVRVRKIAGSGARM